MPPHTSMVMAQESQDREDRRTCRVCRQTKPLAEFSLKNGRPRRVCKLCRMTRTVRQREDDRKEQIKRCFLALGREVRRGRGNHARGAELLDQLQELFGGNMGVVAEKWAEFLFETAEKRPRTPRALGALIAVAEVIRLAKQASAGPSVGTAQRQFEPANMATHGAEILPDFSMWTDEALEAAIEQYQRETAGGHGSVGKQARSRA